MAHDFAILIDGEVTYHPPSDYGDTVAQGEAPDDLRSFLAANPELDPDEVRALKALAPGESFTGGGGAGAEWTVTRVGGDCCRTIDVTYDIVTEESSAEGDVAERGWDTSILITREDLDEDELSWVDAAVRAMEHEGFRALEADSSSGVPRWFTEEAEQDYSTGEYRSRSFHPNGFTDAEMRELARALGIRGFRGTGQSRSLGYSRHDAPSDRQREKRDYERGQEDARSELRNARWSDEDIREYLASTRSQGGAYQRGYNEVMQAHLSRGVAGLGALGEGLAGGLGFWNPKR